ncbi:GDSL esterase/lipase LTL1-like [Carya illinoinensis]|uniref:GDSL esterase/lipase LTL1-like n=1 Tax=Carya illinoinensis TaxID=32201 RepID=UPI001C722AFE|nr:GDSL esterase/lipase LTL1-like [Carya illinoinensis]
MAANSIRSSDAAKWISIRTASITVDFFTPNGGKQNVIPLTEQIQQFASVHGSLMAAMGPVPTLRFPSKSLLFISIGSNDIFEYYHYNNKLSKECFLANLRFAYENQLKVLLELGARKFGIISVLSIGCCPSQRLYSPNGDCLEELNDHARAFHTKIKSILCRLSEEYQGLKYSLGNAYEITINVIDNPLPFNFTNMKTACCGARRLTAESIFNPKANLCPSRDIYLFWDLFHPTEAGAQLAAVTLFYGPTRFVAPINFSQLARA